MCAQENTVTKKWKENHFMDLRVFDQITLYSFKMTQVLK